MKGKKCYRIGGRTCDAKCAAFDEDTGECFVLLRRSTASLFPSSDDTFAATPAVPAHLSFPGRKR